MSKAPKLTIEYQKQTFMAGEDLVACIKLELESPLQAQAVCVDIIGCTRIHFSDYDSTAGNNRSFSDKQVHFRKGLVLWRGEQMEAGSYSFPFSFKIPANSPSTLLYSDNAYTLYYCRAKMMGKYLKSIEKVTNFTVVALCNLKSFPNVARPLRAGRSCSTGFLCLNSGKVTFVAGFPSRGFLCGKTTPLSLSVTNASTKRVLGLDLVIYQYIHLISGRHKKMKEAVVMDAKFRFEVSPNTDRDLELEFKTPAAPPTQLNCRVLQIKYEMVLRLAHENLVLETRASIILGNVPLADHESVAMEQCYLPPVEFKPEMFDDEPPPSYEDMIMKEQQR